MWPWKNCDYDPGPWCEQERTFNLIRELANSFLDFCYLALSFHMFYQGSEDYYEKPLLSNLIVENPFISFLVGFFNLIHFIGTFRNHSSRCLKFH